MVVSACALILSMCGGIARIASCRAIEQARTRAARSGFPARARTRRKSVDRFEVGAAEEQSRNGGEGALDTVQVHPRIGMLAPWTSVPLSAIIGGARHQRGSRRRRGKMFEPLLEEEIHFGGDRAPRRTDVCHARSPSKGGLDGRQ